MGKQAKRLSIFKKYFLLQEGARQIYNSAVLNRDITLENMIPLDSDTCLVTSSQKFFKNL